MKHLLRRSLGLAAAACALAACEDPARSTPDERAPDVAVVNLAEGFVTNDSSLMLEVKATDSEGVAQVAYVLNGGVAQVVAETADADGVLRFRVGPLAVGENTILVRARDAAGNQGEARAVVRRRPGIQLDIISPADGDTAWGRSVPFAAEIKSGWRSLTVTVNGGAPRPLSGIPIHRSVADLYDLRDGLNTIVVSAEDTTGATATRTLRVTSIVPQVRYSVRLIEVPGRSNTRAFDANSAGMVVGYFGTGHIGSSGSFVWQNGSATELPAGFQPRAVNNEGTVVGSHFNGASATYVWRNGTYTRVPVDVDLGGVDINDRGDIVGTYHSGSLWRDGVLTRLQNPNHGPQWVRAINNAGTIAGYFANSMYYKAGIWRLGAEPEYVPVPARVSEATAINEAGQVIGWSSFSGLGGYGSPEYSVNRAFIGTLQTSTDLSSVIGYKTVAERLNDGGTVVGTYEYEGKPRIFLYKNGRVRDVVLADPTWRIESFGGITASEQLVVTANQTTTGIRSALFLTPEP